MNEKLFILHLEDDENDAELLLNELESIGVNFYYKRVDNESDFIASLKDEKLNLIFSDYSLPTYNGLKALEKAADLRPDIPFILISGTLGEDVAVESMKMGATDYVLKNKLYKLIPSVNRAVIEAEEKSRRKSAETRYGRLIESARDVIFTLSTEGKIISINKAFEDITGLKRNDWLGKEFKGLIHPEDLPVAVMKFKNTLEGIASESYEIRFISAGGNYLYGEILTDFIIHNDDKKEILGIVRDITERKKSEQIIISSLMEKEVLLKEIHHRVKNNLQIIISLINMQSSEISDPGINSYLKEIQNRVISMSLIHQSFYQSNNLSDIDFSVYIQKLAESLFNVFGINKQKIKLSMNTSGIKISIDTAIPIGLLINEILSNSLKYGFEHNTEGDIYIELKESNDFYHLKIGDNGSGIPDEIKLENSGSLGMTLIKMLCEQVDGKIELNRSIGTEYKIVFPAKSYKDRLKGIIN